MTWRITWDVLASGQPRPYADHRLHVRVTFEYLERYTGGEHWGPNDSWKEPDVRAVLKTLRCGFTDKSPENWASPVLQYLKETAPGVWEFVITEAYTG